MKVFLLSLCMAVMFNLSLFAQTTLPQYIPQSPNAYSLGKYGDVPVSLYTGIPSIGVPIYNLADHDVSVDISLSYYSSGIKVDEEATSVGLGWSLNAGGVIVRSVRGRPDDIYARAKEIKMGSVDQYPSHGAFISDNDLQSVSEGNSEPDQFYFNFNGRSGKFCFDKDGHVVMQKQEGLDISWVLTGSYSRRKFIIKDESGSIYEFNDVETVQTPENGGQMISSWYLSQITSATGNLITFEYSIPNPVIHYVRSSDPTLIELYLGRADIHAPFSSTFPNTQNSIDEIKLVKIVSSNGTVQFNYKNEKRMDMSETYSSNSRALEQIIIYKPDNSILKKIKLSTSYFEPNNSKKYNGYMPELYPFLNYRLRLDAVQEFSANDIAAQPPYQFSYLGDNNPLTDDLYTLPHRLSAEQDHWGYYNNSFNTHLFPGNCPEIMSTGAWYKIFQTTEQSSRVTTTGGANRQADTTAMKAGMLSRVTYPLGGYTDLVFESNYSPGYNAGGVRIKTVTINPVIGKAKVTNYAYRGYSNYDPNKSYYEFYRIKYPNYQVTNPSSNVLRILGLPTGTPFYSDRDFLRITPRPQAVLGKGASNAYDWVRVSEAGNGYVDSNFDNSSFQDYDEDDGITENTPEERALVGNLFHSEFVDDYPVGVDDGPTWVRQTVGAYEWPYTELFDNSWKRGTLNNRGSYSENGTLLKAEFFTYNRKLLNVVPGFKAYWLSPTYSPFLYVNYGVPGGLSQLKSAEVVQYDKDGLNPVSTLTSYYYDNPAHLQPTRVVVSRSDGKKEVTLTNYPMDYAAGTTFIDNMVSNHLLAYPVETVNYLETGGQQTVISGVINKYKDGGQGLKDQEQVLESSTPLSLSAFKFSNRTTGVLPVSGYTSPFAPDDHYKPSVNFYSYDIKGNILSLSKENGPKVNYIWSYEGQYPIAKIENAEYSTVESVLGQTAISTFQNSKRPTDAAINSFLAPLRTSSGLKDALVNTYTYKPLLGISSSTDAGNRSTYYTYDIHRRLKTIKDQNNNIIKLFCYNYAGLPQDCDATEIPDAVIIYARLEIGPGVGDSGNAQVMSDFYVRFYADENCTVPFVLAAATTVSLQEQVSWYDYYDNTGSSESMYAYNVPAGVSSYYLGKRVTSTTYFDVNMQQNTLWTNYSNFLFPNADNSYVPVDRYFY